jgi:putative glutamine transport system substrate-binding protein
MKQIFLVLLAIIPFFFLAAQIPTETLEVTIHYYENYPFAYKSKSGKMEGIEIDIFKAFEKWAEERKGIRIQSNFIPYTVFGNAYRRVRAEKDGNHIGMATVSITADRQKEIDFSSPYLKNKSLLVSGGHSPTLYAIDEIAEKFKDHTALTIQASIHEANLMNIKRDYFPDMKIDYRSSANDIIDIVARNEGHFAYVDIVSFWYYVSSKTDGYVKIQRAAQTEDEYFGFIFPLVDSKLKSLFNEFMDGGFGFVASKVYDRIIQNYLGDDIRKYVDAGKLD